MPTPIVTRVHPETPSAHRASSRRAIAGRLARAAAVLLVSCPYVTYVFRIHEDIFWTSGLGDWMDPYFINALMEHWYRVLGTFGDPASPTMFFPATRTLGYSHGLVLYAPFYVLPRLVTHPFVAGSLALALVMQAGIVCLYLLLRRLKLTFVEALPLTVFFFTSQNVINGATGIWAQRLSVFLIPQIALLLVIAIERRTGRLAAWLAGAAGFLAALLYAQDVYTAHFSTLLCGLGLAAVFAIEGKVKPVIQAMLASSRTFWRTQSTAMRAVFVVAVAAGAWALAIGLTGGFEFYVLGVKVASHAWRRPAWGALAAWLAWLWMNRRTLATLGAIAAPAARARAARPGGWFAWFAIGAAAGASIVAYTYLGAFLQQRAFPEDQLLASIHQAPPVSWRRPIEAVQALRGYETMRPFMLTVALAVIAWLPWSGAGTRARRYVLWLLAVAALVYLTPFRFGDLSAWRMLVEPLPGFGVIRDPKRIIYVFELALVIAIALLVARLPGRAPFRIAATGLAVLLLATAWNREVFGYARPIATFERWVAAPIAVDPACRSFYVEGASQTYMSRSDHMWTLYGIDAMFVSFTLGLPTLNGYSALVPEGWELGNPQEDMYDGRVARWIRQNELAGVCAFDIDTRVMRPAQPHPRPGA